MKYIIIYTQDKNLFLKCWLAFFEVTKCHLIEGLASRCGFKKIFSSCLSLQNVKGCGYKLRAVMQPPVFFQLALIRCGLLLCFVTADKKKNAKLSHYDTEAGRIVAQTERRGLVKAEEFKDESTFATLIIREEWSTQRQKVKSFTKQARECKPQ